MDIIKTTEYRYETHGKKSLRVTQWHEKLPPTEMAAMMKDGWELFTFQSPFILAKTFDQEEEK